MASETYWTGLIDDVRIYNRAVRPQSSLAMTEIDNGLAVLDAASPLHPLGEGH